MAHCRPLAARRGLTLIELVVVLAILAAVAAIVAPLMPNMLRRAHKTTEATQIAEVSKAVQLYQASYLGYPDNFDLLTDGSAFPGYLPSDGGNTFGGFATPLALTTDEANALAKAGVSRVQTLVPNTTYPVLPPLPFHPTMNPYPSTISSDAVAVAENTTTKFAVIQPSFLLSNGQFLQSAYSADPTARYIVLGVGPRSSMVGTVLQEAPTIAPGGKTFTPSNSYSRVGVIFKVSGTEVTKTERARFIAAVILEDDALETGEQAIVAYYGLSSDPNAGS